MLSKGLRVAAAVVGASAVLSAAAVGLSASNPAGATTVGQISVLYSGSSQSADSWTVSGSGFGSGQYEIVEAIDQKTGSVLASTSVTATVSHFANYGFGHIAFVRGGNFSAQLTWAPENCDDVHVVAYGTPVFIDGHSVYMANSNSVDMGSLCLR